MGLCCAPYCDFAKHDWKNVVTLPHMTGRIL